MKKIDHIKKMVYIIVGILTIISLVFTLYGKIVKAASSDQSPTTFSPPPLLFGEGIGPYDYVDHNLVLQCLDYAITHSPQYSNQAWVVMPSLSGSSISAINVMCPISGTNTGNFTTNFNINYYISYAFNLSGNNTNTVTNASFGCYVSTVFETINGQAVYKSGLFYYPLYVYKPDLYLNSNGVQIFAETEVPIGPSGHSKGGVLSNYIDSEDLLENSSDLPKVDTTPPSDPSSNSGWFQKILNGIGRLNQSVQGGVLTIGDYIGSMTEKIGEWFQNTIDSIDGFFGRVEDKLSDVIDSITDTYDWFTEDFDKNQFQNGINSIPLISDLNGLKTLVENSGLFNWSDVTPAQSVSFTFDFGGAVLPHSTNTIDFSWYTGNVKTLCNAILCTFLVLGLFVTVVNQVPSIIGGHSGDKGGGSDS